MISEFSDSSLSNYGRQGFFTRNFTTEPKPRLMAYRGDEIYVTEIPTDSKGRYMSYSFDRSTGFSTRIVGVLEGPRITFKAHYIFSGILRFGDTSNELFFGCIGEMGGVSLSRDFICMTVVLWKMTNSSERQVNIAIHALFLFPRLTNFTQQCEKGCHLKTNPTWSTMLSAPTPPQISLSTRASRLSAASSKINSPLLSR